MQDCGTKLINFRFVLQKSLSDKCPVNLTNENNILTKLAAVLQILFLSCIRFQTDSCPASVENIREDCKGDSFKGKYFSLEGKQSYLQQK